GRDTPARLARPGPAGAGADGHPRHRRINDTPRPMSKVLLQAESHANARRFRQDLRLVGGWVARPPAGQNRDLTQ
ncbi:MAG TPA: hypothetical protein PK435_13835, partial [Thermoanaerobaculaceae bacterium]|nr:hypothetical protein [Thermoanaerobaculaceae bacterium]